MIKERLKKFLNIKVIYLIICFFVMVLFICLRNTHAYYNYEMEPVPIFTSKVGNFSTQDIEEYLESQENSGLETRENMQVRNDRLRRYQGSSVNNYICFGTKDKNECIENQDKYMYRIIGIDTKTQELKIIKKEALDISYSWNRSSDVTWNNSSLYIGLKKSYFLKSSDYSYLQDNNWLIGIADYAYDYGDLISISSYTGTTLLENEKKNWGENVVNSKVSLMYLSDYYLAMGNDANCYSGSSCKTGNWLHISNNDTNYPSDSSGNEWTMSRYNINYSWYISSSGNVSYTSVTNKYLIRPVMYLRSNVKINGSGTEENPFIIEKTALYKRPSSTTGDTSSISKTSDINVMYYIEDHFNLGQYILYNIPPLDVKNNYKLDKSKSNCIPKESSTVNYPDYYINDDGRVTINVSEDKPYQVVCRIYYSFNLTPYEIKDGDIRITTYIESETGSIVTIKNNKTYIADGRIPKGYTMSSYECDNLDNVTTDIIYDETKGFTYTTTGKNTCYAYFDKVS